MIEAIVYHTNPNPPAIKYLSWTKLKILSSNPIPISKPNKIAIEEINTPMLIHLDNL